MSPRSLLSLSPAFERRLAKTPLRRRHLAVSQPSRSLSSSSVLHIDVDAVNRSSGVDQSIGLARLAPATGPPSAALSALLSRLSLTPNPRLHPTLLACLTHRSYTPPHSTTSIFSTASGNESDPSPTDSESDTLSSQPKTEQTNEVLCSLGNSLLGMFASEHLAHRYPLLPTEALKSAVTAYVGPGACVSVARELGVATQGGGNMALIGQGKGMPSAGIAVRWNRQINGTDSDIEKIPVARRFKKYIKEKDEASHSDEGETSERFQDVIADVVKAFIGFIYQENGIHAARTFTRAHFFSRHLDLGSLFSFKHPKHVLASVVARHMAGSGVKASTQTTRIESRLLASSGKQSPTSIYNIGLFLPSGLKLSEGSGSSLAMAEHRAAVNALLSLYLIRGDLGQRTGSIPPSAYPSTQLPSSVHSDFPLHSSGLTVGETKEVFEGSGFGGLESTVESSRRKMREGRVKGAKRTNALSGGR